MSIRKNLKSYFEKLVEILSIYAFNTVSFIQINIKFALAVFMTLIFYLPALKNGSIDAGFLYGGDVLGWYLPALAKTHSLMNAFNFSAIDYSTFNGSSDFFLSPNFFAYHPLVVIFSILFSPETTNFHDLGHFLVLLMASHTLIAFYFTIKLFTRFFGFDFGAAAFLASVFAFSIHVINALGQPPFFICASIISWAAYSSLVFAEKTNLHNLTFACLPIIIGFLGGYMPLGVASLVLSIVLIAVKSLFLEEKKLSMNYKFRLFITACFPYFISSIIIAPFLYSVYQFHQETSSAGVVSLFYSAHQLAQLPQSLLQSISTHFRIPGPMHESSIAWGIISILIAIIFFSSTKAIDKVTSSEWIIFKIFALIYFATVLATFGNYSVVSDLVYYLVPQVGGMHIYQRFFLPAQLVFAVTLAIMLNAVIKSRPLNSIKIVLVLVTITTFIITYIVAFERVLSQEIGFNNYLVFELLLGILFLLSLVVPSKNYIYGVTIILVFLPALDRMYDYTLKGHTFESQSKRQIIALDKTKRDQLVNYLKRFSDKDIIKYIDVTPMWNKAGVESFPKVFPYFVLKDLNISSYGGFTFYLSARADYMRKMPVGKDVTVIPDWEYLKSTGADFIVARESDLQRGALNSLVAKVKATDKFSITKGIVILPLRTKVHKKDFVDKEIFDNGYFRISPFIEKTKKTKVNIALGKPAIQSSNAVGRAELAVDGNTNGDFSSGSVTHTKRDINAWLEIDLGKTETIDRVHIWNRTDCCGYRLNDYWIFISDIPFKKNDTASDLKVRDKTWSKQNFKPNPKGIIETGGVTGQYIRVQLPGKASALNESFLSIAEVEVYRSEKPNIITSDEKSYKLNNLKINKFSTNDANYLSLDFNTSAPVSLQYLFWKNPRIKFYLNGKQLDMMNKDSVHWIRVPKGNHKFEVKYTHWKLNIFWIFYALYILALLWLLIYTRVYTPILGRLQMHKRNFDKS